MKKLKKIFVGMSGGVDSSVSALRLKKAGYDVTGVFIKVWNPDFLDCNWEQERLDAMRVAAHLDIPFLTYDAEEAYKKEVADYMIEEYKKGRTPNPDVMCNKYVKFGVFLDFALKNGVDAIATGHYAQILKTNNTQYQLIRGVDKNKDQTYFLWTLTQKQLSKTYFPVGDTPKPDIRKEAKLAGLPIFDKADSQGVCFLGQIDMKEFLSHYVPYKAGDVLDEQDIPIGKHDGALFYTIGQRHGFTLEKQSTNSNPLYVTKRNLENNTITVSSNKPKIDTGTSIVTLTSLNFIDFKPEINKEIGVQCRYRQKPFQAKITNIVENILEIIPLEKTDLPPIGQSAVLYTNNTCLGGGIINKLS